MHGENAGFMHFDYHLGILTNSSIIFNLVN